MKAACKLAVLGSRCGVEGTVGSRRTPANRSSRNIILCPFLDWSRCLCLCCDMGPLLSLVS